MKKRIECFCISLFVSFALVNCSNKPSHDVLESCISNKLKEYNLFSDVTVIGSSEKDVTVKIYFKNGKSHSNQSAPNAISFFLDEKSNEQLIDLLVFSCNEHIIDNTSTTFELSFEGYTDKISRRFNKQDIENVIARFDKAKKFRSFSEYAFRQMGYIGVLESTEMIKHLGEKYSDLFNYKGDFWDLLYDYSVACENPKENPKSIYLFISFAGSMKVYDDRYGNSTYRDHMKYFLNECGYEEKLLDFTAVELIEFIENKYNLNNTANKSK